MMDFLILLLLLNLILHIKIVKSILLDVISFDFAQWVMDEMAFYGEIVCKIVARPFIRSNEFLQFLIR